jgi:hypothetical protein
VPDETEGFEPEPDVALHGAEPGPGVASWTVTRLGLTDALRAVVPSYVADAGALADAILATLPETNHAVVREASCTCTPRGQMLHITEDCPVHGDVAW